MIITILEKVRKSLLNILTFVFWIAVLVIYRLNVKPLDTVVFLDVGQGDATLIQNGNLQLVVDGGNDISILYELQKYIPFYDREIEYILLTHPHNDHLVGLLYILNTYEVGEILYYPVCFENSNYEFLLSYLDNLKKVKAGDTIRLGNLNINIIWPREKIEGMDMCNKSWNNNINNDSLVLKFRYLNRDFLLLGDAEQEVEKILISEKVVNGKINILKAGHHCSRTSSSETFLKTAIPDIAICSSGEGNKFGHPSSETLHKFDLLNVQYFVTSRNGSIQIK